MRSCRTLTAAALFVCLMAAPYIVLAADNPVLDVYKSYKDVQSLQQDLEKAVEAVRKSSVPPEVFDTIVGKYVPELSMISGEILRTGESGLLLDVVLLEKTNGGRADYVLGAILPRGFGQDPADAAYKSMISSDKLYTQSLLSSLGIKVPDSLDGYVESKASFGIFLKREADGLIKPQFIAQRSEFMAPAELKWKISKSRQLNERIQPMVENIRSSNERYKKLVHDYEEAARQRQIYARMVQMEQAQVAAARKLAVAEQLLLDAQARAESNKAFSTASSLLGLASTVASGFDKLAEKAKADAAYNEGAKATTLQQTINIRTEINNFFNTEFNIRHEDLPPQTPIPMN